MNATAPFRIIPAISMLNTVDHIAESICKKGLGTFSIFILESHKPLLGLVKSISEMFSPIFTFFLGSNTRDFIEIIQNRERVEDLIQAIEVRLDKDRK